MKNKNEHHRMLDKLRAAQAGDEDAQREVAVWVWENYQARIYNLYSKDPAFSKDDLQQVFFLGIAKAVMKAKLHLGNPFEYIAWVGRNNVLSLIRANKARFDEALDESLHGSCGDFSDIVVERVFAKQAVEVLATVKLTPSAKRMTKILISGAIGDPSEAGFNRRVAKEMDITPQRASQVMASIRKSVETTMEGDKAA